MYCMIHHSSCNLPEPDICFVCYQQPDPRAGPGGTSAVTSPARVGFSDAETSSVKDMQREIAEIKQSLVSVEAMVKENASMFRSVMLTLQNGPAASSQGSGMASSASAEKVLKSGRKRNSSGVESNDSSRLSDYPGYTNMVEELCHLSSSFRVRKFSFLYIDIVSKF